MRAPFLGGAIVGGLSAAFAPSRTQGQLPGRATSDTAARNTRAVPRYERSLLLETTSETSANVGFGGAPRP